MRLDLNAKTAVGKQAAEPGKASSDKNSGMIPGYVSYSFRDRYLSEISAVKADE